MPGRPHTNKGKGKGKEHRFV